MRVELYTFKHGGNEWHFTNARKNVTHETVTYKSVRGLQRNAITDKDIDKSEIDVELPQAHDLDGLEQLFLNRIFYQGVYLTIFELEDGVTLVMFKGRVIKPSFDEDSDKLTLTCSTAETEFRSRVFTRQFQRSCPNQLFDRFCGLKIEDWSTQVRITAIDDSTHFQYELVDPLLPIEFPTEMGMLIKDGVATMLAQGAGGGSGILYREHVGLAVNDIVLITAGCNQSRKMCHEVYSNQARFGGFLNIPNENPVYTRLIK